MTKKMARTPWYPGSVKPARVGVYERKFPHGSVEFCSWNGKRWLVYGDTVGQAAVETCKSIFQTLPWRGLTAPANVKE